MSEELKSLLGDAIGKFNAKAAEDPKVAAELEGITRKILIDLADGTKYNFTIADKKMQPIADGPIDEPDLTITSDAPTMLGLLKKEIKPMKAFALGKVKISGKTKLEDMLRLRKFF
ncbi:MAG: SCP2 sterol-binding domain-containing protein [Methanobacteriota archaeon]